MIRKFFQLKLILILIIVIIIAIPRLNLVDHAYAQDLTITEFPSRGGLWDITSGSDGNLWFTANDDSNKIGQITPDGIVTDFSLPTYQSHPMGIASGPDGNLWFTENGTSSIGRISPNGVIDEFKLPANRGDPLYITSGSNSKMWFTEYFGNKIGYISTEGSITEFSVPTDSSGPWGIASGLDGDMWFTEYRVGKIGKITSYGNIVEFQIPTDNNVPFDVEPFDIVLGADGNMWFTENFKNKIGKISNDGTIVEFLIPTSDSRPHSITAGPDGNIWFTEINANKIGRITPEGTITEFPVPTNNSSPAGITAGPDGNIWFTEYRNNKIGRINLLSLTPTPTPTPIPSKIPLILIPGIGGSEFKSDQTFISTIKECGVLPTFTYSINDIVWVNTLMAGISPCDDYFDVLKLKVDGQTPEYPQIVLNNTLFEGAYGEIIKFFIGNGYELDKTLFLFPYDWRKDISLAPIPLDNLINTIKTQTGSQKVDIVAHSMGGLVARNYIADSAKAQKVRKLFTLGTPHLGSVDSLKNLRFGGCLTRSGFLTDLAKYIVCLGIAPLEIKDIIQNMISGYELAPSQAYFNFYSGENSNYIYPYKTESGALNYTQIKSLLTSLNFNTPLFNPSESFHALDNSLSNTNGVDVIVIAGSGQSTLGQIIEEKRISLLGLPYVYKDMININGDKTVPLFSASLVDTSRNRSLLGNAKVFYTKQEHGNLVSSGPALNLVKNFLNNSNQLPDGVSNQPYHFGGTGLSVHSPVNIHVYDLENRHTGITSNGDFEANIPGSTYDTLGDAKFIFLPDNGQYEIKFEATDQGSFDFKIRKFENDINTMAILYNNIPLTTATKAETILDTSSTEPPTLQVDQDGNGTTDEDVSPTFILTGNSIYDYTPPEAKIFIDQGKQDLTVIGVDSNPTTVTKLENTLTKKKNDAFYLIIDAAGNSLKLDVREIDRNKKDRFRIYSIQYNEDAPIILDNNHFNVTYQGKKDKLNVKEQNYELKGEIKIRIQYNVKKNKSTIIMREPKGERIKAVIDGLVILELNTDNGQLRTYFTQSSP